MCQVWNLGNWSSGFAAVVNIVAKGCLGFYYVSNFEQFHILHSAF